MISISSFFTPAAFAAFLLSSAGLYFLFSPLIGIAFLLGGLGFYSFVFFSGSPDVLKGMIGSRAEVLSSERYVQDVTHRDSTAYGKRRLIGRSEEYALGQVLLRRAGVHLAVIGEAGAGKQTFIHSLFRQFREDSDANLRAGSRRFYLLDVKRLALEASGTVMEKERYLRAVLDDILAAGAACIFLQRSEELMGGEGAMDISCVIHDYASHRNATFILALRTDRYQELARKSRDFENFETLFLRNPDSSELKIMLRDHFSSLEERSILFTESGLAALIEQAETFLSRAALHERALALGEDIILALLDSEPGPGKYFITREQVEDHVRKQSPLSGRPLGRSVKRYAGHHRNMLPRVSLQFQSQDKPV